MSGTRTKILLAVVLVTAALECVAAAWAYRSRIDPEDWQAVRDAVDELPNNAPVILATEWLGPRARLEVPRLADLDVLGRPDLLGVRVVHVLALGSRTWSNALDDDLAVRLEAERIERRSVGPFHLDSYALRGAELRLVASLLTAADLEIQTPQGLCRGSTVRRCSSGRVALRFAEIDERPRRCWVPEVEDGMTVTFRSSALAAGQRLIGHVGFGDFNGVLRNDAPARIDLDLDGTTAATFLATDAEGWKAFELPIPAGTHEVALRMTAAVLGQWTNDGYSLRSIRPPCVELRAFASASVE